jgi:hypothetical protein
VEILFLSHLFEILCPLIMLKEAETRVTFIAVGTGGCFAGDNKTEA